MNATISVASKAHYKYAAAICQLMEDAAKVRGTGIAKRKPEYLQQKMMAGQAVIALDDHNSPVGFCYIETWEEKKYVANSGLIVHPDFRSTGLAKKIKGEAFQLSKRLFPESRLFGITTSMAVMKINTDLGYRPATFSEITQDDAFWKGCATCVNYDILQRTERKMCLCTAMVATPKDDTPKDKKKAWENMNDFFKKRRARFFEKFGKMNTNLF